MGVLYHPIQRLLFYQYPCSKTHFVEHIVPNLKKSLSQTLRHYRPVAGKLIRPILNSEKPELRYSRGDSVSVTFAETNGDFEYFNHLTGNHVRDSDEFYSFVPDLPEPVTEEPESGFTVIPLLAIKVTLFPEIGICIGFSNHHAIGDASSIVGFIKSWSSVAKFGGDEILNSLPFYDRSVIKDSSGRANIFWNQMQAFKIGSTSPFNLPTNRLRATFILQKHEIQQLKNLVSEKKSAGFRHLSSFTVTASYVWACLAKASAESGEEVDETEPEYFMFAVDARHRMDPPVTATYFGNCVAWVMAESSHGVLKGEDGFITAAELVAEIISKRVDRKEELLRDGDDWLVKYGPILGKRLFGVSGSPKFDLYDTDFGWGNPNKYESASIDRGGSMSLCKSREFEGGLEIGMSLPKKKMEIFGLVFRHTVQGNIT